MCLRKIFEKMGQFRTYNDYSLAKRLVRAEQDLKELKANQLYFMNNVVGFESNSITSTCDHMTDEGGMRNDGWTGILTFTGNKPEKDVVIVPKFEAYDANGNKVQPAQPGYRWWVKTNTIFKNSDKHICSAFIDIQGYNSISSIKFWVVANDVGVLSLEKKTYEFV